MYFPSSPYRVATTLLIGVLFLSGCSSLQKVDDWFAKTDSVDPYQTVQGSGGETSIMGSSGESSTYQSRSAGPANANSSSSSWSLPERPSPPAGGSGTAQTAPGSFPNLAQPATAGSLTAAPSLGIPSTGSGIEYAPQGSSYVASPAFAAPQLGVRRGGAPAPSLVAKTMGGSGFDLKRHRGRVVLLDFWRKTCGPCIRAMPKVEALRKKYPPAQLTVVGINCDERLSAAKSFVRSNPHSWPNIHAHSQSSNPIRTYGVRPLPTFIVIDQIGNVQYRGGDITAASSKVTELVATPTLARSTPA